MDFLIAGGFVIPMTILEEVGRSLLEARERLGLTLDEAERATRIRVHHLEAIERGDMEALPSPVQARGFLHNYAEFLGLDADAILLRYAEAIQSQRNRFRTGVSFRESGTRPSVQIRSRRPRWLSADLFVAAVITLTILTMLIWGGSHMMAVLGQRTEPTDAPISLLIPSYTPTLTKTPQMDSSIPETDVTTTPETTELPTQPVILGIVDRVNLRIIVERRAWLCVVVDGEEIVRGRVMVGDILEFQGEQVIELTTGNGAGLRVFYNGQDQGLLGEVNQVVVRLWTLGGALTPTATVTRTPTETPRVSGTPSPTSTPPSTPGD